MVLVKGAPARVATSRHMPKVGVRSFVGCTMRSFFVSLFLLLISWPLASAQTAAPKPRDELSSVVVATKGAFTDVKQGRADTCWILASLAALEYRGLRVENRIRYEGNNLYTVKLFNYNTPAKASKGGMHSETQWVYFDGTTSRADPIFDRKDPKAAWVVIMQRAVIQAIHDWDQSQVPTKPHSGGAGDALAVLTGRLGKSLAIRDAGIRPAVETALASKKVVVLNTKGTAKTLVANHSYTVLSASGDEVTLYNPWGSRLTVAWDKLAEEGSEFVIH
jgi:hypothetical protein